MQTFDPTGSDLSRFDPLAPVGAARTPMAAPSAQPEVVAELSDRATVQMSVLRRTLEEAIRLDRSLGGRAVELGQRLEQGANFTREMDRRLIAAGSAVGVLDKAATLLKGLEGIVTQLRDAQNAQQQWMSARLDEQRSAFEQALVAQQQRFEQRATELERTLGSNAAVMERNTAAATARVAVMLDEAQQRLVELEAESTRVGAAARERIERACETAAAVLGHDPRLGEGSRPVEGSLIEVTARAESAARQADDAVLRLSAMTDRAAQSETRLADSITEAKRFDESQSALREAIVAQAESETRLVTLRDDLESVAASARYNLSQAQQAEASLLRSAEQAAARIDRLDRAMSEATEQARGLVQVARDVGGMVVHAERVKEELATVAGASGGARGATKRGTLGTTRARDEGDAQSVAA